MTAPLLLIKMSLLTGLACWLSTACFNNIIDPSTNRVLLSTMLSMQQLKEERKLGQGLLKRARINYHKVSFLLWLVVCLQMIISILLWSATFMLLHAAFAQQYLSSAVNMANWSLLGFIALWLWFLCGGLWYGYWIKMSQVQTTHLLLLLIGLLSIVVMNIPLT